MLLLLLLLLIRAQYCTVQYCDELFRPFACAHKTPDACTSMSLPYSAAQANSLVGGDLAMADKKLEDPTMAEQPWEYSG